MNILGVRIDNFSKAEILAKIENFLSEEKFHQIATINPEFVLQAQKDQKFKNILNQCDLNISDGVGICYAFLRKGRLLKCRIAGADLIREILYLAYKKNLKVFLAIGEKSLSRFEEIKETLEKQYPTVEFFGKDFSEQENESEVMQGEYDIMFCNFGAPNQEKFLALQKNGKIKLAMGVGGTFDFVTGKIKRAPRLMRKIGLEWLWRFFQEPKYRARRIFNAVIVFPIKIVLNR